MVTAMPPENTKVDLEHGWITNDKQTTKDKKIKSQIGMRGDEN